MNRYVTADIHGSFKALLQCFQKVNFDYKNDLLIVLGDIVDGWSQTKECVEELLKIKNLVYVLGNHDEWFLGWADTGEVEYIWQIQGGQATLDSYKTPENIPETHKEFFNNAVYYYELDNKLFVHGGIDAMKKAEKHSSDYLTWDRSLIGNAIKAHPMRGNNYPYVKKYDEVFLGHTSTVFWNSYEPIHACNVWNIDTGAGAYGKLTIMNIDTKTYWQSDLVRNLYPKELGRN